MSYKLTVALDADEVLLASLPVWLRRIENHTGVRLRYEEIVSWDFLAELPPNLREIAWAARVPEMYRSVQPVAGAVAGVWALQQQGHRLVVVTADTAYFREEKVAAIRRHFGELEVVLTYQKDCVQADLLVDDGLHNISPSRPDILLARPWNANAPDWAIRAADWSEVVALVSAYAA